MTVINNKAFVYNHIIIMGDDSICTIGLNSKQLMDVTKYYMRNNNYILSIIKRLTINNKFTQHFTRMQYEETMKTTI